MKDLRLESARIGAASAATRAAAAATAATLTGVGSSFGYGVVAKARDAAEVAEVGTAGGASGSSESEAGSGWAAWMPVDLERQYSKRAAELALRDVQKKTPACWEAQLALGRLCVLQGDLSAAEAAIEAAVEVARLGGLFGLEFVGLGVLRALVLRPAGREKEAAARLEEAATNRLRKPLTAVMDLLESLPRGCVAETPEFGP